VIFAGGDPVVEDQGFDPSSAGFVIAADSGLHAARALGVAVDLIVGDLDSASPKAVAAALAAGAALERHPMDKDATDLELALDAALERGLSPTLVLGGAGPDRADHFMANVLLIAHPRFAVLHPEWRVRDARVIPVHDRLELRGDPGDIVTLLAAGGPAAGVKTEGLRRPLRDSTLEPGSTRGVSNRLTGDTASISLDAGTLLVVHTKGIE
jgi:thiamine pyrophosphokinase